MIIRRFRDEELEAVAALWHASRQKSHWHIPAHRKFTIDDDRTFLVEKMLPRNELWVAERDGVLVGFMAVARGWVNQLYVAVEAQRTGVGRALLEHAKSSMDEIRLHTLRANAAARAFYAAQGFEEIAFGVGDPPENEPDVLLRWRADRASA